MEVGGRRPRDDGHHVGMEPGQAWSSGCSIKFRRSYHPNSIPVPAQAHLYLHIDGVNENVTILMHAISIWVSVHECKI